MESGCIPAIHTGPDALSPRPWRRNLGERLVRPDAVATAREFIQAALEETLGIGQGHGPTNHWAYGRRKAVRS